MKSSIPIFYTRSELLTGIEKCSRSKKIHIGFVPTMGALHEGHLSLVRTAFNESDIVVVSIFVNPTQFNSDQDLEKYPRQMEKDLEYLETLNQNDILVFAPTVAEMYPEGTATLPNYNLGKLDSVMEGAYRPGHFQGVATIVHRLLELVQPRKAFFGEKDYQQLAVIKHMSKSLRLPVEIVGLPTIRESDGLAMSSRNALLLPEYRKAAPRMYEALNHIANNFSLHRAEELMQEAISIIETPDNLLKLEYLEIADAEKLQKPISENQKIRVFIAVWANNVRLIDNIPLN